MNSNGRPSCRNDPTKDSCICDENCFSTVLPPEQLNRFVDEKTGTIVQPQDKFFEIGQCFRCLQNGKTELKFIFIYTRLCSTCYNKQSKTIGTCSECVGTNKTIRKFDGKCKLQNEVVITSFQEMP
ncbi:hypothetical protein M3Y96_00692200 [Aphelenchoides besseyi]|nr:hypothetical protein M3Y96_00692200 [Aphelenchoides besseyi]